MSKQQIKQEIIDNSPDEQKEELLTFLNKCKYMSQWDAFTVCHWRKTGVYSYQGVRVWSFRPTVDTESTE